MTARAQRFRKIANPIVIAFVLFGSVHGATVDVMTFNIRNASNFGSAFLPPNGWFSTATNRRQRVVDVIQANNPDLLGVQESVALQTNDLKSELSDYDYFGVGRDDGDQSGEQNGIFYRANRFDKTDGGHFWLSNTPEVPGTTFATSFDSGNPRMVTWIVLHDKLTGDPIVVLNTHWSLSSGARRLSAELIRAMLPEISGGSPTIIMGDLNTTESSTAFEILRDGTDPNDLLLVDAYREVNSASNQERTFHDYNGGTSGSRIDHILFSAGDFESIRATIDRTTYNGLHTSDHYPVTTTLRLVPEPSSSISIIVLSAIIAGLRRPKSRRMLQVA